MNRAPRRKLLLGLVATLVAGAGCAEDFEPFSRLTKLRVLALRAAPVNPAFGETTVLDALVYHPSRATPAFSWSWCPLLGDSSDGYRCPLAEAELAPFVAALGATEPPAPLRLGSLPAQPWKNVFPAASLASLCERGLAGQRPDCTLGFPVRISVTVTVAAAQQTATTVIRLPIVEGEVSNQNPGFETDAPLVAEAEAGTVRALDGSLELPRLVETAIEARVAAAQAETYRRNGDELRERLVLSWFVETGDLRDDRTSFIAGVNELQEALVNRWKPGAVQDYPQAASRCIVVLRDDRGGIGWVEGSAGLEPAP